MSTIFTTLPSQLNKRAVTIERSENLSSHEKEIKEISKEINNDPPAEDTMDTPSKETVNVDDPPSQEDQDDLLEASGNCLMNKNFQWPWLTTPFPDSMLPSCLTAQDGSLQAL